MREKVGKSRNTVFFQWFGAPEGRKVGSLKRRVRSQLARWEMKSCTPLWREAHLEVKMLKSTRGSDHFWKLRCRKSARRCGAKHISKSKCTKHHQRSRPLLEVRDVGKVHAVVARSTFRSQNVQNTTMSRDRFWKFGCRKSARRSGAKHISKSNMYKTHQGSRTAFGSSGCRKSARRCGAKHISKSKCTKHHMFAPLLEVLMSKKCTPLWREGHFEANMFDNTRGSDHFWRFRCCFASTTLHYRTLHYNTLHYTTQHYNYNYTTTLHYAPLHSTTLHYITLHYTTFQYTSLHYTTLHSTTLQLQLQLHNYTPLQYTPLHYTKLHYTTLHYTTLHYTPLHYTTLPCATLHYITLHYTPLQI